ncbi:putative chemoreceptor glutamine deamidase CheD [Desulfovibrio desulfuricans]|nr:putative chemoreceptor glutamine deamidase CheD [Desulfovibrio desulfuricans]
MAGMPAELMDLDLRHLHLRIGEGILAARPALIATVLGSCVSVTFHHPSTETGGIFHAMLPTVLGAADGARTPCKYVDAAIETLLGQFARRGIAANDLVVKLFGGAFTMNPEEKQRLRCIVDVGGRNVEVARATLQRFGIEPQSEHILGDRGRKLFFHSGTGEVWVRLLRRTEPPSPSALVCRDDLT